MAKITITVDRSQLPDHTDDEFEEWIKFEVGYEGGMDVDNPLAYCDIITETIEIES